MRPRQQTELKPLGGLAPPDGLRASAVLRRQAACAYAASRGQFFANPCSSCSAAAHACGSALASQPRLVMSKSKPQIRRIYTFSCEDMPCGEMPRPLSRCSRCIYSIATVAPMETARGVTQCFSIVSRCQRRFLAENGEHVAAVFAVAFLQRWRRDVVCSQRGCYVVNYGLFLSDPTARRRYTPSAARVSRQADGRRGLPTFASPQGLTRSRCPAVIKQGCRSLVQLKKALSVAHLPALPQSAIRLLELSKNPTTGPAEFAIPIEFDPGLAGQVLRFVNSSYFGFAREISSVKMAIALVGMRRSGTLPCGTPCSA